MRLNLSRKYSEQYGEGLARKASRGDGTAKFKIADGRKKQRVKVRVKFHRLKERLNFIGDSEMKQRVRRRIKMIYRAVFQKFCVHKHENFHRRRRDNAAR